MCIRLGLSADQWHVTGYYLCDRLSTPYSHNKDFCGRAYLMLILKEQIMFSVASSRTTLSKFVHLSM